MTLSIPHSALDTLPAPTRTVLNSPQSVDWTGASPPALMAPWAAERCQGLLRQETKIKECIVFPARNCDAAAEINSGVFLQNFLKGCVIQPGDVGGHRTRTPDCFPFLRFDQERDSVETVVSGGKDSCVGFDGAFKQTLVVKVGDVHLPI
ncbi:MAG: hypothetical protein ABSH49_36745 [Bryobacteraceae bacterium]